MPLTQEEASEAYSVLTTLLRDQGLEWIVQQVEERIALGDVEVKSVKVRETPSLFRSEDEFWVPVSQPRKNVPATLAVSREFTPQERLGILLEATKIGVVQLSQIADSVVDFYGAELEIDSVRFAPEAEVKRSFELTVSDVNRTRDERDYLLLLLNELQRELR